METVGDKGQERRRVKEHHRRVNALRSLRGGNGAQVERGNDDSKEGEPENLVLVVVCVGLATLTITVSEMRIRAQKKIPVGMCVCVCVV